MSWLTFDTEDGTSGWAMGTASFEVECGDWTHLCAKDEQHTLYDTQALTDLGTEYVAAADFFLMAGDTDNDSDVDIHGRHLVHVSVAIRRGLLCRRLPVGRHA